MTTADGSGTFMLVDIETPENFAARLLASGEFGCADAEAPAPGEGLRLVAALMRVRSGVARSYLMSLAEALATVDGKEGAARPADRGVMPEAPAAMVPAPRPRPATHRSGR